MPKAKKSNSTLVKNISYHVGILLRSTVEIFKKPAYVDTCKKLGKIAGEFQGKHLQIHRAYKATAFYMRKAYKNSRKTILIAMWKEEHPDAGKTETEAAIRKIEGLYKS